MVTTQAWIVAVLATTFAACDEPRERIGVELSEQGLITVEYKHCRENSLVEAVVLKDLAETRTNISDDRVLWEIQSPAGSPLKHFEIGSTPDGFEERVPLHASLDGLLLNVQVRTSALPQGESMTFTKDQLRVGELRVGTEYMSADEFRRRSACD